MSAAGIVVVSHNSEAVIGACLDAALATGAPVVVVDNASQDGTRQEVLKRPGVRLLANPWNRGFAAAVNQGMEAVDRPCILLLNPDAVLLGGLDSLVAACQEGAAVAGGKLVDGDGRPQAGFMVRRLPTPAALAFETLGLNRLWPGNPVNRRYRCRDLECERPADVEQPAGAFAMIRRDAWRRLGGWDECFRPLWFEDVDFCWRARQAGLPIRYVPQAVARHLGGHSVGQLDWERRQLCWYDSLLRYSGKHFRPAAHRAVCAAVVLRFALRALEGIIVLRRFRAAAVHGRIVRLGLRGLAAASSRPEVAAAGSWVREHRRWS